ncbi:hypothetical protein O181_022274 [Austropuccinia psidii MF-1]|uniref:Uncharacterized protein n=1 Tax=Austropuccinia psidii MF-1 TaxID=1389203 RepID=A0A9Q3GXI0_9BASI|nr:hypothetical protein [Austropuccinia psidii MF-1]
MEKDPEEGKLVESEDEFNLYKQNDGNWEDKYKQQRRFKDIEEGDLSENSQGLAGPTILEPNKNTFHDTYEQICFFSNS